MLSDADGLRSQMVTASCSHNTSIELNRGKCASSDQWVITGFTAIDLEIGMVYKSQGKDFNRKNRVVDHIQLRGWVVYCGLQSVPEWSCYPAKRTRHFLNTNQELFHKLGPQVVSQNCLVRQQRSTNLRDIKWRKISACLSSQHHFFRSQLYYLTLSSWSSYADRPFDVQEMVLIYDYRSLKLSSFPNPLDALVKNASAESMYLLRLDLGCLLISNPAALAEHLFPRAQPDVETRLAHAAREFYGHCIEGSSDISIRSCGCKAGECKC